MQKNQIKNQILPFFLSILSFANATMPVSQPKDNVWVTLANASGLDTICLTNSRPEKPFSTCLVGIPVDNWPIPRNVSPDPSRSIVNPTEEWSVWTKFLPQASFEPQELEILGSVKMEFCITFSFPESRQNKGKFIDVSPNQVVYRNLTLWCNVTTVLKTAPNHIPLQLPRGIFLICGDRVWPAIPANIQGGPCSIGRLTLLTPHVKIIEEQKHKGKRSVDEYRPDCNDNFRAWNHGKRFATALFLPQAAAGAALKQLDQLGCWLSKRSRAISIAISDLLVDAQGERRAILQNRAAIDFLLLVHGHGCKDFAGMCCMNLSDHSISIHKSIQDLQDGISKLRVEEGSWLDDLTNWLSLTPLWKKFLKIAMYVLITIIVIIIFVPCLLQCIRQRIDKAVNSVFIVQRNGGIVGSQEPGIFELSVLSSTDPPENTLPGLKPWRRFVDINNKLEIINV